MNVKLCILAFFLLLVGQNLAYAVQPNEMLPDPMMEQRARILSKDLRCLVCQNQSIDDSDADLAHDLRILLRQRLLAGDSDAQAKQYLVDRYGDYVLLTPPFKITTLALWSAPFLFLLFACIAARSFYFNQNKQLANNSQLSEEDDKRLANLLANTEENTKPEKVEKL
jgi:cytochrome c-type biogenesis protein CcmH